MSDTDTVHAGTGNGRTIVREDPTGKLRWHNGILEQEFDVVIYLDGPGAHRTYMEWRPVPTEDGDE